MSDDGPHSAACAASAGPRGGRPHELDESIVIGTAADDFDEAFETLLKPYIGMIGTNLGIKGVK